MTKKYISKTCLSINVILPGGVNRHISFSSLTGGGSVFYTDDEALQNAIESHRFFGKGISIVADPIPEPTIIEEAPEETSDNVVKVSSLDEAKDYLSDKFGVSRTKMKGVAGVTAMATKNGIVFEGL